VEVKFHAKQRMWYDIFRRGGTNKLTTRNEVLLGKITVAQLVNKLHTLYGARK